MSAGRILPTATVETGPYWDGCRRHELLIQRCVRCGHLQFFPRLMCSACLARELSWVQASGQGLLKSFTVVRRAVSDAFAERVPYVVALVQLDEGPTMMSNIVACTINDLVIGMRLEVVFEDWPEGISMPQFTPIMDVG
jgi:uncharacterized OB-fold protein